MNTRNEVVQNAVQMARAKVSVLHQEAATLNHDGARKQISVSLSDFLADDVPSSNVQRATAFRVPKLIKFLRTQLGAAASVLSELGRITVRVDANGNVEQLDGHTRIAAWRKALDNSDATVYIPDMITVDIIRIDVQDDAEKAYYTFDNAAAAESGSDILTGLLNKHGIVFSSPKFQKGAFKTAMDAISGLTGIDVVRTGNKTHDMESQLLRMEQVLYFVDNNRKLAKLTAGTLGVCMYTFSKYLLVDTPCNPPGRAVEFFEKLAINGGGGGAYEDKSGKCPVSHVVEQIGKGNIEKHFNNEVAASILYALGLWMNYKGVKGNPRKDLSYVLEGFWTTPLVNSKSGGSRNPFLS